MSPSTTGGGNSFCQSNHTRDYSKREARTLIRLALLPELTGCLDGRFASVFVQICVAHNFATNELVLKVGMDDASRLWRLGALAYGPRAHFSGAAGEVSDQLECQGRADVRTGWMCVCVKVSLRLEKCILLG